MQNFFQICSSPSSLTMWISNKNLKWVYTIVYYEEMFKKTKKHGLCEIKRAYMLNCLYR